MKGFKIQIDCGNPIVIKASRREESPEKTGWEAFYDDGDEPFLLVCRKHIKDIKEGPLTTHQPISQIIFG